MLAVACKTLTAAFTEKSYDMKSFRMGTDRYGLKHYENVGIQNFWNECLSIIIIILVIINDPYLIECQKCPQNSIIFKFKKTNKHAPR